MLVTTSESNADSEFTERLYDYEYSEYAPAFLQERAVGSRGPEPILLVSSYDTYETESYDEYESDYPKQLDMNLLLAQDTQQKQKETLKGVVFLQQQ